MFVWKPHIPEKAILKTKFGMPRLKNFSLDTYVALRSLVSRLAPLLLLLVKIVQHPLETWILLSLAKLPPWIMPKVDIYTYKKKKKKGTDLETKLLEAKHLVKV